MKTIRSLGFPLSACGGEGDPSSSSRTKFRCWWVSYISNARPWLAALAGAVGLTLLGAAPGRAEPFVPANGAQVLERLRSTPRDAGARRLHELRGRLANDPQNLQLALELARGLIERCRQEADPRYLGRAQAVLAPWWGTARPPTEVLVLRGTIRQSQHDFTNALADLQIALAQEPHNAQAWLTRATILTVLGEYPEAKRACVPLAQLAPGLVAVTAAAGVACLNGEAERSSVLLRNALESYPAAEPSAKVWALTVLGETAARLGRGADAEAYFKRAFEVDPADAYLRGAYADLLLDQERPLEACALLQNDTRADGLLLRLVLAESKLAPRPAGFQAHLNDLSARFEAGHRRGDFVHQREEACFALHLAEDPGRALRLAVENWRVQHEPADARILLESALAEQDRAAARPVLEFLRHTRLEDVRLTDLAGRLEQIHAP